MNSTEGLLRAWREAERAVDSAEPGTPAWRQARLRADRAKTAYLTRVGDVFDVEGHHVREKIEPDEDGSPSGS